MGYGLRKAISLSEIAGQLDLELKGVDIEVLSVSSFLESEKGDISFSNQRNYLDKGAAYVIPNDIEFKEMDSNGYLLSRNQRMDFIRILDFLKREIGFSTYDFTSVIDPTVIIGRNVVIENGCRLAEGVIIEHNVVIHSGTVIGRNSRIRSCSSIGGDGFGFERLEDSTPIRFQHLGGVIIGENVEVGSCTTIARGSLSNTVIEDNVKIDNLVHIAHNCYIKKGAFIIACAEISGGVVVGENAWVAPNSSTHQKINIGNNSLIGLGSVVTKDVPESAVVAGNPAKQLVKKSK